MRFRAFCLTWLLVLASGWSWAADLTVGNYTLQSSRRVSATDFELVYKAQVTNTGPALKNVIGTLTSNNTASVVIEGTLSFGDVGSGASVISIDTFTVRQNRSQPFRPADLVWNANGTPAAAISADFVFSPAGGNAPIDLRFTPTPTTVAAIVRFEWDFDGDGVVDVVDTVGRNQTRRYTTPGTYPVSLRIVDSAGRTDTRIRNVVIGNAPPTVSALASPSNGQVPLTVRFTASATDSDGVATYEWDFDGNGTYDSTTTINNTSFVYTVVGTFTPRVRVTDRLGVSSVVAVPAMEVRAAPVGSPQATLSVSRATGAAPLAVRLSATVSDPQRLTVQRYDWDVDGDGTADASTTTTSYDATYSSAGTYYPRVRVTMTDGRSAEDVKTVTVTSTNTLSLSTDTLDTQLAQSVAVDTILSAATRVSIIVERRGGGTVRTLIPPTTRSAGSYSDTWDGKSGTGQYVDAGIYHIVLLYDVNGVQQRLDLSTSTGGREYNPTRTPIPSTFEPFNHAPLAIDFTLTRASEVTAFMGSFNVDTRYVTFYTRQPFGRGTYRLTWNGENSEGQIIKPAQGDAFLFGIFGYELANNAVFVRNGVQLNGLLSGPPIFDPTGSNSAGIPNSCSVQFNISSAATAELTVQDTITGAVVNRIQYPLLPAGTNTISWDGKASDGRYAAPGTYRLGLTAIQSNGFRSLSSYVLQRVFY